MLTLRLVAQVFPVALTMMSLGTSFAQDYPNRAIRIVTSGAGGGGDYSARLIAQGISGTLGQPVIVENRGGGVASGAIVANAPPDGYTLLNIGSSHWLGQFLQKQMPYDAVKDFSPVTLTVTAPYVLVVHPSLPVKSVKELIALAKTRPGELTYAVGSIGGPGHLAGELFKSMAGVNMVRVNYRGDGPALNSLLGGEVQLSFCTLTGVPSYIKSGRLRAVAVTSALPSALVPGLPTIAASGLPGYEMVTVLGVFVPARTPNNVINRVHQEIVRFLGTAAARERFLAAGFETVGSSPEGLAETVNSEIAKFGNLLTAAANHTD